MNTSTIDTEIRIRLESFAFDLAELITKAALDVVETAVGQGRLQPPERAPAARETRATPRAAPAPRRREERANASAPVSLDGYERMAIQRALAENGGDALAAAKALKVGKSTIYRRMHALDIERANGAALSTDDRLAAANLPLDLLAYEKAAVSRAIDECGGNKLAAAHLLGIGKSTLYRLTAKHAL